MREDQLSRGLNWCRCINCASIYVGPAVDALTSMIGGQRRSMIQSMGMLVTDVTVEVQPEEAYYIQASADAGLFFAGSSACSLIPSLGHPSNWLPPSSPEPGP